MRQPSLPAGPAAGLAADRQGDAAGPALLAVRESTREDPEVNVPLARLEAPDDDVAGAVRYYQTALYGSWSALAAAFNTPVAAVLFALEEIIGDMNATLLGSTVVASVASVVVERSIAGNEPLFRVPAYHSQDPIELLADAALGIVVRSRVTRVLQSPPEFAASIHEAAALDARVAARHRGTRDRRTFLVGLRLENDWPVRGAETIGSTPRDRLARPGVRLGRGCGALLRRGANRGTRARRRDRARVHPFGAARGGRHDG